MDFTNIETQALEERKAAIATEATEDRSVEELTALKDELCAINEEIGARKAAEAERRTIAESIAQGAAETITINEVKQERKMDNIEIRNSKPYIDAFAEYIKTGNDTECRALLTENVTGTVPVPEFVYDIVKTAWERDGITRRVRKAYLKGNLKVSFEISGSDASIHTEGGDPVAEENLVLGVVTLTPVSIKKWVGISDEVMDMRGTDFLNYIYDEITYRIAKKAADTLIEQIVACGTVSTTTQVSVPVVSTASVGIATVVSAMGALAESASENVVILNRQTEADIRAAALSANYFLDPFAGLPTAHTSKLPAASAATTGQTMMIIGDLGNGALMNFPAGDGIEFKFDDVTLMTSDLIRILGRQYVGIGVVAPNHFVKVVKN